MVDVLVARIQHLATHALLQIHLEFQVNFVHALLDIIPMELKVSVSSVKIKYQSVVLAYYHQVIQKK
jgi:hypothetical protein